MTKTQITPRNPNDTLDEVVQAKIRLGLHTFFVVLTFVAHIFDQEIPLRAVFIISAASFASAFTLYWWATRLQSNPTQQNVRIAQRSASILSDNVFVTLVLAIGAQSTAGLWTIYLWTSIGYGVRYGISYLYANVVVSTIAFTSMAYITSFWHDRPPFVFGMTLGMILVPLYTGFLIKQLHKAVQDREAAYKAKSEFLARMSHELRTPLHAIISTAELLKGKARSRVQNDYVDTIALSSATLLELINRVLDLSKFESGQVGLLREHVNIYQLLADAVNLFYHQAQQKGVIATLYVDPAIPLSLVGSPAHVREVLLNIVGNAIKFTERGSVSLSAQAIYESPISTKIRFEIRDTGTGIPERDLSRIFEPFMQADQSITRKHGGSGLGTSFSREILRLMGGDISITSVEGQGTNVTFSIPFNKLESNVDDLDIRNANIAILGRRTSCEKLKDVLVAKGVKCHEIQSIADLAKILGDEKRKAKVVAVLVDSDAFGHALSTVPAAINDLRLPRMVPVIGIGNVALTTAAAASGFCSHIAYESVATFMPSITALIHAFSTKGAMSSSESMRPQFSRPLRVLIADDNATNRKIAKIALEEAGHRCTLVTNGDDALFALNDVDYDVALLDMHMPGRDGIEVAKIYRFAGFAQPFPTPIILLTADCTTEARVAADAAGISKFLTKPILPSEIVRTVEQVARTSCPEDGGAPIEESAVLRFPVDLKESTVDKDDFDVKSQDFIDHGAITELVSLMSKAEQQEFFTEFYEDAASYIEILDSVSTAADVTTARDAMHALAGAALIIGAGPLAGLARKIENSDSGTIVLNRNALAKELKGSFDNTVAAINHALMLPQPE